jgi:ribosomal protein S18 acetylase RimI-like enzyme
LKGPFEYRRMRRGEETEVSDLILRVFEEFVAPQFSREGVQEFQNRLFLRRSEWNHSILVALANKKIVGMIETKNDGHITLFFVDGDHQGEGVGRELLKRALEICRRRYPEITAVTVSSAPNAVKIYERLGFRRAGPERTENQIRFVPMVLDLFRSRPQSDVTGKVKQKVQPSPSTDSTHIRPP